jgi:hypothetical protein
LSNFRPKGRTDRGPVYSRRQLFANRGRLRDATALGINTSGPGRVESDLSMKTKTHFAFRVDIWDDTGAAAPRIQTKG